MDSGLHKRAPQGGIRYFIRVAIKFVGSRPEGIPGAIVASKLIFSPAFDRNGQNDCGFYPVDLLGQQC